MRSGIKHFVYPVLGAVLCGFAAGDRPAGPMGAVVLGENIGGMTDRVFFIAGPNDAVTYELSPGSFLDCGAGQEVASADRDGRGQIALTCGVSLTETLVVPSAGEPARLTVYY